MVYSLLIFDITMSMSIEIPTAVQYNKLLCVGVDHDCLSHSDRPVYRSCIRNVIAQVHVCVYVSLH